MLQDVRGHLEGCIGKRRKDGLIPIVVTLYDGTRHWRYARDPKRAKAILREMIDAREGGLDLGRRKLTLAAWLRSWLETLRDAPLRPRTLRGYAMIVEQHIIPELGAYPVARLPRSVIQTWIYRDRRAPRTVAHHAAVLREALNAAVDDGVIARNPALGIDLPKPPQSEQATLSADQVRVLLAGTRGDWLHALWALAIATGFREAELLGLTWDDVDLDVGTVTLRYQLGRAAGGWVRVPLKAARDRAMVALPAWAVVALVDHKRMMADARTPEWTHHGHVFVTRQGRPWYGWRVLEELYAVEARLGLPRVKFHGLRHTGATMLMEAGVEERVRQARLGHSTVAMARHYAHVKDGLDRDAADRLERLVGG